MPARPAEVDVLGDWDRPLYERRGGLYRLDGIDVLYDFEWPDVMGHDRAQFPGGRSLALSVKKTCPRGKTPVLVLTVREDVNEVPRTDDEHFYAIVKITQYLEEAQSDQALTYWARKVESGMADIEHVKQLAEHPALVRAVVGDHLDVEHVVEWMRNNPDKGADVLAATESGQVLPLPPARTIALTIRALTALDGALTSEPGDGLYDSESIEEVLQLLARILSHLPPATIDLLPKLGPDALLHVSALLGVARLNGFLRIYKENKFNSDESFWQETLKHDPWVISQLFCSPMVILRGQAYVGGKAITNTGGKLADFLYRNPLTRNAALVEIKTPAEPLLGSRYRDGVYPPSQGVAGAITQVLTQQQELQENISALQKEARMRGEDDAIEAFRPRAVVIAGSIERESLSGEKLRSFELYRNGTKDVELVTFDELARKVENLLDLLVQAG